MKMVPDFPGEGETREVAMRGANIKVLLFVVVGIDRVRDGDPCHVARQLSPRDDKVELNAPTTQLRATFCERVMKAAVEPVGSTSARAFSRVLARRVGNTSDFHCLQGSQPAPSQSRPCLEHLCESPPIVHHGEPGPTGECVHTRHGAAWLRAA